MKDRPNGKWAQRRDAILALYVRGCQPSEIAKLYRVSRQRIGFVIRYVYKFLPQSRYMLEGALCRDWMLRHRPKEYRTIVERVAAEQSSQVDSQ